MFKDKILSIIAFISVIIVLLIPFYSKYVIFPKYNEFLILHAEEILKEIGKNMTEHNNLKDPITLKTTLPKEFLENVEHIRKINNLWKVKLFTANGVIVYSTDPDDVGNLTRKDFFPEMFKDNKLRSHIDVKKYNPEKGFLSKENYFIETYVPIEHNGIPIGAFEIYYDITKIKESLETLKRDEQKVMVPIILLLLSGGLFSSYIAHRYMSELKRSQKRFRELSILDELTGLLNRRGFSHQLEKQLDIINRGDKSAFLIFVDLNDFKLINDKFGHEVGDEALVATAKLLTQTFRNSDFISRLNEPTIGRLGGDEFAILATQIDDQIAIEAIHKRIENNLNNWNRDNGAPYTLSLSFGVAFYSPDSPRSADELISEADRLMYQQKEERKNKAHNKMT